ncbi:MAG TPA: DUF72 domain-containing protein [Bacilli bacterium]|nr:DUF72 domain-containing protein [Bacilli bacterium]
MIRIGLTGWRDHDSLYDDKVRKQEILTAYASYFPVVEVDSSFYAIQPQRNFEKWLKETPQSFQFIVKAFQGMTGHDRGENPYESREEMFETFVTSLEPLVEANRLAMVLFQFPPWFDCKRKHVQYLRYCKEKLGDLPCALEFRHQSWFEPRFRERTLQFMRDEGWIHTICDEPRAGTGSIPIVLEVTHKEKTLIRFHGRNVAGWNDTGQGNWRDVRYLYRYNREELAEWALYIEKLKRETKQIYVIFNNNSGGDAADNARQFIEMLDIEYDDLAPRQLSLFD